MSQQAIAGGAALMTQPGDAQRVAGSTIDPGNRGLFLSLASVHRPRETGNRERA